MNVLKPVSTLMSTNIIALNPDDSLKEVKEIFDEKNIHHIPVVKFKKIVGMVSKTDFLNFLNGYSKSDYDKTLEKTRMTSWKVKDIMTEGLAKIDSKEPIRTALGLFKMNRFHALPIVDNDELVGIVTTWDIINAIAEEPINLEDYKLSKV
jgi:acetoin utilization protein AcuB